VREFRNASPKKIDPDVLGSRTVSSSTVRTSSRSRRRVIWSRFSSRAISRMSSLSRTSWVS
jgi:hypothetical protein